MKAGKTTVRPRFPLVWTSFSGWQKDHFLFLRGGGVDAPYWKGWTSWSW